MRLFTDLLMVDMQKTIRSLQLKTAPSYNAVRLV
jgi:hypothetical protein